MSGIEAQIEQYFESQILSFPEAADAYASIAGDYNKKFVVLSVHFDLKFVLISNRVVQIVPSADRTPAFPHQHSSLLGALESVEFVSESGQVHRDGLQTSRSDLVLCRRLQAAAWYQS
jgi:hypothetical protein